VREVHPSISSTPIALDADDLATVCVLCSHNCGIRVDVRDGRITDIRADESNPITQGYICNKAVTVDSYAHHEQRVTRPLRRTPHGGFEPVSWEVAIAEIAGKLGRLRDEHGPRSIALVGIGGQANHMDAPFASSFLHALGSRRWFNAYAQEKTQHHLVDQWMFDAPPMVFFHPDLEHVRYLVVMGTNPRISNRGHNPNETFKHLAKREDCTVVVVDPRETETTRGADRHLRVRPGSDAFLLLGMAAAVVQNELYDAEFLRDRTQGFDELRDLLARVDVSEMAARCGLARDAVLEVATGLAQADGGAIMFDLGVEQTPFSTLNSYLIRLLLVLTGNVGREGGNIFIESMVPPSLGARATAEPERALASGIAAIRALGNIGMFSPTLVPEEILVDHPERIRAVIVEGANPMLSYSDTNAWREALARLDLLVVIDPAFTETAQLAHYVLPTPVGYEKWEIAAFPKRFPEIDVQLRPPVIPALGDGLPEPEIYTRLVEAMGLVDPLPDGLRDAAAPVSADSRALYLMTAMSLLPDVIARGIAPEPQMLFWGYRALAHHFPAPSLVAVWLQSNANAGDRRDAILRTLGPGWEGKTPMELGEAVFQRILAHPEGVEIARLDPASNLDDHLGHADKRVRVAPPPMLAEMERALAAAGEEDPLYPFVLASGLRTRWTANTIQRDPAWRKARAPHCEINLAPLDAQRLGVAKGDLVRIETRRGAIELPAAIDAKLNPGHCWMPNGFGVEYGKGATEERELQGANCNEITDAGDRDPFTGCPHHRYVRVQLRAVGRAQAPASV
jgi:anaerobic selenocysteine-containing dehydrogenase